MRGSSFDRLGVSALDPPSTPLSPSWLSILTSPQSSPPDSEEKATSTTPGWRKDPDELLFCERFRPWSRLPRRPQSPPRALMRQTHHLYRADRKALMHVSLEHHAAFKGRWAVKGELALKCSRPTSSEALSGERDGEDLALALPLAFACATDVPTSCQAALRRFLGCLLSGSSTPSVSSSFLFQLRWQLEKGLSSFLISIVAWWYSNSPWVFVL